MLDIYVDGDGCPVKREIYSVASRYGLKVFVVSNSWMRIPESSRVNLQFVGEGLDAADDWIVERVEPDDIVVTADALEEITNQAEVVSLNGIDDNPQNDTAIEDMRPMDPPPERTSATASSSSASPEARTCDKGTLPRVLSFTK